MQSPNWFTLHFPLTVSFLIHPKVITSWPTISNRFMSACFTLLPWATRRPKHRSTHRSAGAGGWWAKLGRLLGGAGLTVRTSCFSVLLRSLKNSLSLGTVLKFPWAVNKKGSDTKSGRARCHLCGDKGKLLWSSFSLFSMIFDFSSNYDFIHA